MHNNKSSSTPAYLPWLIWGLGCMFYFYENLLQVSLGVISSELMRDLKVTSQALGLLSGIYFYSYAGMQLPGGLMMDYYGPQRLLSIATLICGFCTIGFALTDSFWAACIARLLIGFGSAFAAVGCMKIAASWFSPKQFPVLTGLMVTLGMLGSIVGEAPLALLTDTLGWRDTMLIMGGIGLVLGILIRLFAKDAPNSRMQSHSKANDSPLLKSLWTLLHRKQLWIVATYGGLMYLSTPVFCGLWGVPFFMVKMHVSKALAANYVSIVFFGWVIASPLWGLFSNNIGKRKPPLYIGSIGCLITSTLFLYVPIGGFVLSLLMFLFGFFSAAFLPAFTICIELCSLRYAATALSFMNMMNMIGIAIIQPLIGTVLDRMWTGAMAADMVRVYPLHAYQISLTILPLCIGIALLLTPFIQETYCRPVKD